MPLSRRAFLSWAASAVPIAVVVRRAHALSLRALSTHGAPSETLDALGETILPSELGAASVVRVVGGFRQWIAGYREGAELTHGYGTSRIRSTGPSPATRWTSQLDALDASARKQYGASFTSVDRTRREALVRSALGGARVDRLPSVAAANHVVLALLAYFYESPEATDLCYGSTIGARTCRPLAQSPQAPAPLRRRPA